LPVGLLPARSAARRQAGTIGYTVAHLQSIFSQIFPV